MDTPPPTSGRLAYAKLYAFAKIFRAVSSTGSALGRLMGGADPIEPPDEVVYVKSSKSNRTIRINIHRNALSKKSMYGPTRVHMNWHAGGWMLAAQGQNGGLIRTILHSGNLATYPLTILDCSYALSPEWPCPADTEDARDSYDYVLQHPELYDASKVTMSGFSAGGTIALGLSVTLGAEARAKEQTGPFQHPVKAVMTFYPRASWMENSKEDNPIPSSAPGQGLPKGIQEAMHAARFFNHGPSLSIEEEAKRIGDLQKLPAVSPIFAPTCDFPPIVAFYSAELDTLMGKTEELRERLIRDGGVELLGKCVKGVGHAWDLLARPGQIGYEDREEAYNEVGKTIARAGGYFDHPVNPDELGN
ncbi:alpha/beta-hydrolase [Serendipita vermifera]|nr:alpha/beta-hydrolase [Serendipita vermifera]